jgi:hypothetical protein
MQADAPDDSEEPVFQRLLARSEYLKMEAIKLFAKVRAYVAQPERFLYRE